MARQSERRKLARREALAPAWPEFERPLLEWPWRMMRQMEHDINRLFWQFGMPTPSAAQWAPAVDVWETDSDVKVCVDLPGVDPKDVEAVVTEDSLTIRGQAKEEEEFREEGVYQAERSYGAFERIIPLPTQVQTDKAKACFKHGTLSLTLPKSEETKRKEKKISIVSE